MLKLDIFCVLDTQEYTKQQAREGTLNVRHNFESYRE